MVLTVNDVINKIRTLDSTIKWVDDAWGRSSDEHESDILGEASDLLKEYRSIIMKTKVDL